VGGKGVGVGGTGVGVGGTTVGVGVRVGGTVVGTEVAEGSGVSVDVASSAAEAPSLTGVGVGGNGVHVGVDVAVGEGGRGVGVAPGAYTIAGGVGGAANWAHKSAEYVPNDVTSPIASKIAPTAMRRVDKNRRRRD